MINFRYHIVSITAVFLALGIGTALGSTFLDRATVDLLDRNISSAETRIQATDAENRRLQTQVDAAKARDQALIQSGVGPLMADQLADVPVLLVVAPDVNEATADAVSKVLAATSADFRGTLTLTGKMAVTKEDADLAADLGLKDPKPGRLRKAVNTQLLDALVAAGKPAGDRTRPGAGSATTTTTVAGAAPTTAPAATTAPVATTVPGATTLPGATTTTTAGLAGSGTSNVDGEQPAILTALIARGYVTFKPGPGVDGKDPLLETTGYRYVFLSTEGLAAVDNDILLALLPPDDSQATPTVVVSTTDAVVEDGAKPIEPSAVARIRAEDDLARRYTTVDNVDTFSGLAAAVVALGRVEDGKVGHYGQAKGANAVFPPPS